MSSLGFSYAQAARGITPSSNVSSNPASSASSEQGTKDSNTQASSDTLQAKTIKSISRSEKESSMVHKLSQGSIPTTEVSPSLKTAPSVDSVTDDHNVVEVPKSNLTDDTAPIRKGSDSDVVAQKAGDDEKTETTMVGQEIDQPQEKSRVDEDDWEKVSVPSLASEKTERNEKEKEVKAAPIPAVNFWTQRSQELQAKLKEQASKQKPSATVTAQQPKARAHQNHDDTRKKSGNKESTVSETKGNSSTRIRDQQSNATPTSTGSQQSEKPVPQKPSAQPVPRVDAESWPTPESAIVDSSRRSSAVDRAEKSESVETKAASRKQWQAMPFVPSVKFETQLPNAARRGGRAPTGRGRGGLSSHTDRSAENVKPDQSSMGPPPLPKFVSDQDRGRKSNALQGQRASSVPTENQRVGVVATNQVPDSAVDIKPSTVMLPASSGEHMIGASTPQTEEPSRSSSRHASGTTAAARPSKPDQEIDLAQPADLVESPSHRSTHNERAKTSATEVAKNSNDTPEKTANKDWQKERANNQKSESWRGERRGGERTERGRGNYRGRGNHGGYNPGASFTSPLPQNGFEAAKSGNNSDSRNRQPAQPYASPYGSTRGNPRAQSIPIQMLQGGFYQPAPGFPPNLPPIQTDMNYSGYGQVSNMPSTIVSAMPYGDQLGGFALISMVVNQMEYYFSLDNLCKDMYLRKHMDSQGFVPLRVIGEFRRIKALLGDSSMSYDQLRHVAQQVRNVEFVVGEDGEERLRNRENWKDFVLPMDERLPQAQNDGPKVKQNYPRYSTTTSPDYHISNGLRSAPPNVNGFHDAFANHHTAQHQPGMFAEPQATEQWASRVEDARQGQEDRRDSLTSSLAKVQSSNQDVKSTFGSLTNGHRDSISSSPASKENTFPDEEVAKLKVVVKDPEYHSENRSDVDEPAPTRVSGLRGSAGSPEQFDKVRSLQFGQSSSSNARGGESTIYFTQGEAPPHYLQPGYIHEEYYTLREKALSQRAENHFGGACVPLYPLWAEFLTVPNQFNVGMYEDFRTWALEDVERGNDNGKMHLVKFYDVMLSSKMAMTERLSTDIVNLARSEPNSNRPTWLKLRNAWRNGATNMKTRKRLTELLTKEEQTELERGT